MDKKKVTNIILAMVAAGVTAAGATNINFTVTPANDEQKLLECLTVIDGMIKTHSNDLVKVTEILIQGSKP
ncbi:TMhelix containing protein [Vibrio phage 1.020.O._10N.222.48.A2]|uniref:TMhelix containing protein n=1 Tax=Vibrio phage 1.020.O._10N.222.48.A2 TaxID=1881450 RepID=A0A2I7QL02_9VIRU|nr:TMhelix containing protein [Vibrio phage 1.020.O._10N.222.48.A2]AUR82063.1 TMhelix containing protein [Vibrio phage 1.020.O._10N.222.48.A2]